MSRSGSKPPAWAEWKNPHICLYHGTILTSADTIRSSGVRVDKGVPDTDFGQGFYTTTWLRTAREWSDKKAAARAGSSPAVLKVTLDRVALSKLTTIAFIRSSLDAADYWSFVSSCRNRSLHIPASNGWYDVAYGPVAQSWRTSASSRVWDGYDQISFHTPDAETILNDPTMCTVELVD